MLIEILSNTYNNQRNEAPNIPRPQELWYDAFNTFQPNLTIGKKHRKIGLPEGGNRTPTKRDQHKYGLSIFTNI